MFKKFSVLSLCFWVSVVGVRGQAPAEGTLVYVGTYTGAKSKGIYAFRFNQATGALTPVGLVAETPQPELAGAASVGAVPLRGQRGRRLRRRQERKRQRVQDRQGLRRVDAAQHAAVHGRPSLPPDRGSAGDPSAGGQLHRRHACRAAARSRRLAWRSQPGRAAQGIEHQHPRQTAPHAHSIDLDADNRFAISSDLGADRLFIYRYDPRGGGLSAGLQPAIAATPGAGPRHFAFHPNGQFGFAINELSSTVTSYAWDARARARSRRWRRSRRCRTDSAGTTPLPRFACIRAAAFCTAPTAATTASRCTRWAWRPATSRWSSTSRRAARHPATSRSTPAANGSIAANQGTDTLAVFRISDKNGALTPVGPLVNVGSPVSVVFLR